MTTPRSPWRPFSWRTLLALWLVLLVVSGFWRARKEAQGVPDGAQRFELAVVADTQGAGARGDTTIPLDVWESGLSTAPGILLLHGSPGQHGNFDAMLPYLQEDHRILAVDLPGFGVSSQRLPDYSPKAHALYLADWLQRIDAAPLHLVGHSMGGAVALRLQSIAPERVASITLISSLGVEELELLGDPTLNKALHGVLLSFVTCLDYALPHFGKLHSFPVNVAHARNFFDDRQAELRPLLEQVPVPFQILHGTEDLQVPVAAAREHARIVPQAVLHEFPKRGHFIPWQEPERVAAFIHDFVAATEDGSALDRAHATGARLTAAQAPFDPTTIPEVEGMALIMLMLLLALATLISEDLTCLLAGWLVSLGRLSFLHGSLACFLGILVGDLMLYVLGRIAGRPALRRRPLSWFVKPESLDKASHWMQTRGARVIFLSRFTPGLRLPTYLLAGALHTRFLSFAGYFALACAIWTPILVGLSAYFGQQLMPEDGNIGASLWKVVPVFIGLWIVIRKLLLPACTWRGRRGLAGSYKRLTTFEFWHPIVIYGPIVPYLLWQAVRHRNLAPFAATNPGILGSGFAGESKGDILDAFGSDERIPKYLRLRPSLDNETALDEVLAWQTELESPWPLAFKPDVGERGKGVHIVRSVEDVRIALASPGAPWIVQEFVPGPEFGVLFKRDPSTGKGTILSITTKQLPSVTGDGTHSLGDLVQLDSRAVALADAYEKDLGDRWAEIPALGEQVRLVEVGTHSRGAIFLDGQHLNSPALSAAIDDLSLKFRPASLSAHGLHGLYLGRYDLKAPSAQALSEGRNLAVIELNGITSEPTHIYDPRHGPLYGWRALANQWKYAYEIGAYNLRHGAPGMGLWALLKLWRRNA